MEGGSDRRLLLWDADQLLWAARLRHRRCPSRLAAFVADHDDPALGWATRGGFDPHRPNADLGLVVAFLPYLVVVGNGPRVTVARA
jgi:hypothetical protein